MKIAFITLSLLYSIASSTLFAQKEKYVIPWGMGGCGLGTLAIQDKSQWPQLGAYILNNIIVPQTSAITTGTSNCVNPHPSYAKAEQKVYIEANLASLAKDISRGSGNHLYGMAEVFGCNNQSYFAKISKDNYSNIFSSNNAGSVLDNYRDLILKTKDLAEGCSRVVSG